MAETKVNKPGAKPVALTKKNAVASKKTMNLAFHESSVNPKKLIPLIVVLVVAILLLAKFGILDQLNKKVDAINEVSQKQANLATVNARLANYDEVAYQYGRYSYGWMTETESSLLDRMDILEILETIVCESAILEDFAVNNNILNANISGLSLDDTSALVKQLEADPRVQDVFVYTAKSEDAELNAQVAMTVILTKEAESK